mmetsp:Transcript_52944/g.113042  ORF Transcript_52944/g.113042 Transcript_52944/m.113042 type:complete len:371 (+) Transcript_52944:173-1285(+)
MPAFIQAATMGSFLVASAAASAVPLTSSGTLPMDAVNFAGGLRLTVNGAPHGQKPQSLLLDTGSSTLAFCDASLAESVRSLQTNYMSCNLYGSGNEGYWGFFFKGAVTLSGGLELEESYYSIMQQEVSMPCGDGLQGIFGVAFKQLDQAANHAQPLNWPSGGVGQCPQPSTDLVGPLMQYLKQDTPQGHLGIYWSGATGSNEGTLYVGPDAVSNEHYAQGTVQKAQLGELGYYDVTINSFSFGGQSVSVQCDNSGGSSPCLVDTGTPIMMVPYEIYNQMSSGATGKLSIELAGADGSAVTLDFDAQTLVNNQYIQASQGGPVILGLPLWAFYYTVFDVKATTVEFVQHSPKELEALRVQGEKKREAVVVV